MPPSIFTLRWKENDCVHGGAPPAGVWTHIAGTYGRPAFSRMYVNESAHRDSLFAP
jgi:hypothetical protein